MGGHGQKYMPQDMSEYMSDLMAGPNVRTHARKDVRHIREQFPALKIMCQQTHQTSWRNNVRTLCQRTSHVSGSMCQDSLSIYTPPSVKSPFRMGTTRSKVHTYTCTYIISTNLKLDSQHVLEFAASGIHQRNIICDPPSAFQQSKNVF